MTATKNKISKRKVYSEFFTNFAVAWATAGIIAPLFSSNFTNVSVTLIFIGIGGALASLKFAIMVKELK